MVASSLGAVLTGIEATLVTVEVDIANGLPTFQIVGLPDTSVQEARERVRAAVQHSGQTYPMQRITVNLAPSDVPKSGPALDLAVAVALLAADKGLPADGLRGRLFLGELGLNGEVRPVRGALAAAEAARIAGVESVVCPAQNAGEAALAGLPTVPVGWLRDAVDVARGWGPDPITADARDFLGDAPGPGFDLGVVRGQELAKRVLEIAAAGGHNVLMSGPPGTGKTLLARALAGILPRLSVDEALEVTRIHSAAGLLPPGQPIVRLRPFRSPHHGTSVAGLVGGGSGIARPGEASMAHRGVLFLDELPEFPRSCLEALRQPLEDGVVTVVRSKRAVRFPARFQLVAAMNPCPCGMLGSGQPCRCTPRARESYRQRLSGPLLDRLDMHVDVGRIEADELLGSAGGECSSAVRERVEQARARAAERCRHMGIVSNAELPPGGLVRACALGTHASETLARSADAYRLSARSIHRILRVARTIADLNASASVSADHVREAVCYRLSAPNDVQEEAS